MIFGQRISIEGELKLISDLHIGVSDSVKTTDPPGNEPHDHSPTARWVGGAPMIPSSTLKGVLKSVMRAQNDAYHKLVFGEGSEHENGKGAAANLWLDHAVLKTEAGGLEKLTADKVAQGVFRAKHVAIDPKTGAAADNKLFDREMVGAGAVFCFKADWFGNDLVQLYRALATLCGGVQLGSGTTKGNGLAKLEVTTLSLQKHAPVNGKLVASAVDKAEFYDKIVALVPGPENTSRITMTLTAEGPFLSVRKIGRPGADNEMQPLEQNGAPVLWPTSLAGALRSRARWLAGLTVPDTASVDDADKKRTADQLRNNLSPVERLFGVAGRKADLRVVSVTCTSRGRRIYLTNNSIDRLTGGTRDTALYAKDAFWQPIFTAVLEVTGEHPILDKLLTSLSEGLELGHSTTTGFGWFKVEVTK